MKQIKKIIPLLFIMILLINSVSAFSLFGKEINFKFMNKEANNVEEESEEVVPEMVQEQNKVQERQRVQLLKTEDVLKQVNTERLELGGFEGDEFCLASDEREIFIKVTPEGKLEEIKESSDCYKVKVQEQSATQLYNRYQEGEFISYQEISEEVKLPFKLKMKLLWGKLIN